MSLTLADRDLYLLQIDEEIKNKRQLLLNKKKEIEMKNKQNENLLDVKSEYNKYYNYIITEKQKQYKALDMLKQYVDDLINTEKVVDEQLTDAKRDQKKIVKEISKIKEELNSIIDN